MKERCTHSDPLYKGWNQLAVARYGDAEVLATLLPHFSRADILHALLAAIRGPFFLHDDSRAPEWEGYWSVQRHMVQPLKVAEVLAEQLSNPNSSELQQISDAADAAESIMPVQLAAKGLLPAANL